MYGYQADSTAEGAKTWREEEEQTAAIGEGLAAIAYVLLEVAAAIRDNAAARSVGRRSLPDACVSRLRRIARRARNTST
ncbi:hypothetical protein [Streptomyces sp. NPDC056165]|uniref:hypothetical protein n=1 Tax=Streptomyces sp. NPDC056165 TaxID=3345733 RepID=UPI0035DD3EC9